MKKLLKEFKEFAMKGNVLDLAVAVVLGAAFNKVVTAVVEIFLNPIIEWPAEPSRCSCRSMAA